MGFDVYGRSGNYFRANIWSWPGILASCEAAGFTPPERWRFNGCAGLSLVEECEALATALEAFAETLGQDDRIEGDHSKADDLFRQLASAGGVQKVVTGQKGVSKDHLLEFVAFLRGCGGSFEIC